MKSLQLCNSTSKHREYIFIALLIETDLRVERLDYVMIWRNWFDARGLEKTWCCGVMEQAGNITNTQT